MQWSDNTHMIGEGKHNTAAQQKSKQ